jgi:hypothetical protein
VTPSPRSSTTSVRRPGSDRTRRRHPDQGQPRWTHTKSRTEFRSVGVALFDG